MAIVVEISSYCNSTIKENGNIKIDGNLISNNNSRDCSKKYHLVVPLDRGYAQHERDPRPLPGRCHLEGWPERVWTGCRVREEVVHVWDCKVVERPVLSSRHGHPGEVELEVAALAAAADGLAEDEGRILE